MDPLTSLRHHPVRYAHLMGFDRLGPTHDAWMRRMLYGKGDWTLQAFRGSYKTTTVSAALALLAILYPNTRTAFMRKTDSDVKEVIAQVRRMLESEETRALTAMIWGHPVALTTASATELSTNLTNDPRGSAQLTGMGINGSLTGKHYDRIFTDDIVNLKDRVSRAEREHTKSVYMELQNIRNRGGRIINTGTPWHVDDCFSIMPQAERWDWRSMPDVATAEEIEQIRQRVAPSLFAANYELRHIPSDDVIFTSPKTGADQSLVEGGECHVDAAYGGEDYTAFTAMRYEDGTYYVYGKVWRKHVSDVANQIKADHTRLMLGKLHIETNGDKGFMARDFKKMGIPVVPYNETMNKILKIETYGKQGWPNVVFVDGTDQEYLNQVCDWTEDAEHDDCPDSLSSLLRVMMAKSRNEGYKSRLY